MYEYGIPLICSHFSIGEPFVHRFLVNYWDLVLLLQLGSVAHSPLLVLHLELTSLLPKLMKVRSAGCLKLTCIAVDGLGRL